jgi:hypothetical protein
MTGRRLCSALLSWQLAAEGGFRPTDSSAIYPLAIPTREKLFVRIFDFDELARVRIEVMPALAVDYQLVG